MAKPTKGRLLGRPPDATLIGPAPVYETINISSTDHTLSKAGGIAKGLYVGGTGDVVAQDIEGNNATFKAVPVGTILPIQFKKIIKASTTATLMIALL